jgi:hypothetical protein
MVVAVHCVPAPGKVVTQELLVPPLQSWVSQVSFMPHEVVLGWLVVMHAPTALQRLLWQVVSMPLPQVPPEFMKVGTQASAVALQ